MMRGIASRQQLRASFLRWTLVCVPACLLLGSLSAILSRSGPGNPWFAALTMPAIYPGPAVFPLVWTALYILMGLALAMVGAAWGARGRGVAIMVFAVQFALNLAWSPVFFGLHRISGGLMIIGALLLALVVTAWLFWRIRRLAGVLLLPYLAWVLFAGMLNWQILQLNPGADGASASGVPAARVRIGN